MKAQHGPSVLDVFSDESLNLGIRFLRLGPLRPSQDPLSQINGINPAIPVGQSVAHQFTGIHGSGDDAWVCA